MIKHIQIFGNYRVEVEKIYRTRTQFEWFLTIYMGRSNMESLHLYQEVHLTKKSALTESKRALSLEPKIIRIV